MTQKMTLWAYAQGPKKWPFEHMLKDPKNDPLSIHSRTQKMTLWAYAQGPKKWPLEHMLKDPKNYPLSIRSRTQKITLWAYAQEHIFVVHFHMQYWFEHINTQTICSIWLQWHFQCIKRNYNRWCQKPISTTYKII